MKTTFSVLTALALFSSPFTVLAQAGIPSAQSPQSGADAKEAVRIADAKDRAAREINRRVTSLTTLIGRIGKMSRLADTDQQALQNALKSQSMALLTLLEQIKAATSTSALRIDIESIRQSYRIYALVLPQVALIAAADRAFAVSGQLELLSLKLQERITTMGAQGGTVTTLQATLELMKEKIADAKTKAQNAVDAVVVLVPDSSEQQAKQANLNALKDAHAKIRAAQQDLVAARKDAGAIAKELRAFIKANTATTTPNAN